jgi:hypothetical protein
MEAHLMSRFFTVCGLAAVLLVAIGSSADAGFGHRRHLDPTCAAPEAACCTEPGLTAFEPVCAAEPSCGFEPGCGAETCCPTNPCIKYRHKHAHKHKHDRGCCEEPTYETVLNPTSPETCCTVAVPVCLPACCQGCPCETSRCTLLGCGQVRYYYACGCSVVIRFQKHGDIRVTYVGF